MGLVGQIENAYGFEPEHAREWLVVGNATPTGTVNAAGHELMKVKAEHPGGVVVETAAGSVVALASEVLYWLKA